MLYRVHLVVAELTPLLVIRIVNITRDTKTDCEMSNNNKCPVPLMCVYDHLNPYSSLANCHDAPLSSYDLAFPLREKTLPKEKAAHIIVSDESNTLFTPRTGLHLASLMWTIYLLSLNMSIMRGKFQYSNFRFYTALSITAWSKEQNYK